ncbi:MAG: hypothetical protein KIS83_07250 [Rubrivivax sp.]|nr:hypothetical protein [Rubrivivax sp.]
MRQWLLSLPIPPRVLRVSLPGRVTPVPQVVQRVTARHLPDAAGLHADEGHGGAVTPIRRLGSAANPSVQRHGLVLDGAGRCGADSRPSSSDRSSRSLLTRLGLDPQPPPRAWAR